jgi:hypothetical protein
MADEPAPKFEQSELPGVAAMVASIMAGHRLRDASSEAFAKARGNVPAILAAASTPLSELAEFTRQEVADLTNFAASKGVTAPMVVGEAIPGLAPGDPRAGSSFDGPTNQINIRRKSVPEIMHEIGHAAPVAGSSALRNVWQSISAQLGRGLPGAAARTLLVGNALSPSGQDSDVRSFASEHAPALMAATYAPELIEEGRATASALLGARRFGPGMAAVAREMLPAFGTYATHAAGPVLGVLIAQKIMEALRNRGEEKRAAPTAGKEVQSPGMLRASASSAWRMGVSTPKPKTIKPNSSPTARAKDTPTAKPPSKTAYYSDVIQSLNNPQRGFRQAKPEG